MIILYAVDLLNSLSQDSKWHSHKPGAGKMSAISNPDFERKDLLNLDESGVYAVTIFLD